MTEKISNLKELQEIAKEVRKSIIKQVNAAGSGHPGGSLSSVEILTTLYYNQMNIDENNPKMSDRDKFVLSKGHASPLVYAVLAEKGFFEKEEIFTLRKMGSRFQGHADMHKVPGVEMSTGSLGQGFSASVGMALANKLDKGAGRVYVLLGDGEMQEGLVWEAAMAASHYKLDNLTAILDMNGLQIDGKNEDVMNIQPINEKFAAFGWEVIECDGHNFQQLITSFDKVGKNKPTIIIAKTVKGKGVSFMENNPDWHGKATKPVEFEIAMKELGGNN
ncbi:MAG: transketolase [Anaerovoracaceae bacterium]